MARALDHLSQDQLGPAKMACLRALQADQTNAEALLLLGELEFQAGNLDHAQIHIRSALELAPQNAAGYERLAAVLTALGEETEAQTCLDQVRNLDPEFSLRNNRQGFELMSQGLYGKAITRFQMALAVTPDFANAYYNLGLVYASLGQPLVAIDHYRAALRIQPHYPKAHSNLGVVLKSVGRMEEAVACYKQAIADDPAFAAAHNNLGSAYKDLGQFEEAEHCFRRAIQLDPKVAEAQRQLTDLKKFKGPDDEDLIALQKGYEDPDVTEEQKSLFAFGLAKAFEDLDDFDRAFDYLSAGNQLKRKALAYSIESDRQQFSAIKELFSGDFFEQNRAAGCDDVSPVFILGMPRSGTTLVEQILSSHRDVHGAGELEILKKVTSRHFSNLTSTALHQCMDENSLRFADMGADYVQERNAFLEMISLRVTTPYVTDKMPDNFRLIGFIKCILPNARIIHCTRNPMATCLSIYKRLFGVDGLQFSYDLEELGHYYNLYRDLMAHWHSVMPGFVYDVSYEDLIANQEEQTRALLDHCGLPWDPNCLEFHKSKRAVRTASATQVRKPIYKQSLALWEKYEDHLEPLARILGRQPE